jgi:hypothetical protein
MEMTIRFLFLSGVFLIPLFRLTFQEKTPRIKASGGAQKNLISSLQFGTLSYYHRSYRNAGET